MTHCKASAYMFLYEPPLSRAVTIVTSVGFLRCLSVHQNCTSKCIGPSSAPPSTLIASILFLSSVTGFIIAGLVSASSSRCIRSKKVLCGVLHVNWDSFYHTGTNFPCCFCIAEVVCCNLDNTCLFWLVVCSRSERATIYRKCGVLGAC